MTNHQRAVVLAQTMLLRDDLPVEYADPISLLDKLMRHDPGQVPDGDLVDWVNEFFYRAEEESGGG